MTVSSAVTMPRAAGSNGGAAQSGPDAVRDGKVAPRLAASLVPTITGVRILPADIAARLVNISASGMLVECEDRLKPGSPVTVLLAGSFKMAPVMSRVVRASVSGIGPDGALRYHIGIAFAGPIALPEPARTNREATTPLRSAAAAPTASPQDILRNRW